MGRFDESASELEQVLKIKPDYAEASYTLGTVYKQQGKLDEAVEALRAALRLQPDLAGAHTTLAAVYKQQGKNDDAAEENRIANHIRETKMGLQAASFATNSGIRLLNAGDLAGAISQFEQAIQASPDYAPAHRQLALACQRSGDTQRAAAEKKVADELAAKAKE